MTYVIIFLMMVNGAPTWVEMPTKTLDTGKEQVFYTHKQCTSEAWHKIQAFRPMNVLDYACKRVEK